MKVLKAIVNFLVGFFSLVYVLLIFAYTFGFYLLYRSVKDKSWSKFFVGLVMTAFNISVIALTIHFILIWVKNI